MRSVCSAMLPTTRQFPPVSRRVWWLVLRGSCDPVCHTVGGTNSQTAYRGFRAQRPFRQRAVLLSISFTETGNAMMNKHVESLLSRLAERSIFRATRRPRRRRPARVPGRAEMLENRMLLSSAPVFGASAYEFSISEHASEGALVGTVEATDADQDYLTYGITAGDDNYIFRIDDNGNLTMEDYLDYEDTTTYVLTVEVTDYTYYAMTTVTINVTDVAGAVVFDPDTYAFSVDEYADTDTVVGTVTAIDNLGDGLFFAITAGDENFTFEVGGEGQIILRSSLNYWSTPSYTLTVEVYDGEGYASATVTIEVIPGS